MSDSSYAVPSGSPDYTAIAAVAISITALIVTSIQWYLRQRFERGVIADNRRWEKARFDEANKSEQIRVTREVVDTIEADYRKAFEFDPAAKWPSNGSDEEKRRFVYDYLVILGFMMIKIRYLSHLVEHGEINNETVLDFYRLKINWYLDTLNREYTRVEKSSQKDLMNKWPSYHSDIPRLKKIWEKKT